MNHTRKILIILIVCILAILGMNHISNAKYTYQVGDKITVTWENYEYGTGIGKDIFCMEEKQAIPSGSYTVISKVNIEGLEAKAFDKNDKQIGETKTHWRNGQLAYILSSKEDRWNVVRPAVWDVGYYWIDEVGKNIDKNLDGFATKDNIEHDKTLTNEAKTYAENLEKASNEIKDNTVKDAIKVVPYSKDNKQYLRVGPFNWTFSGKLTNVSVYDQNSKEISEKLYSTFSGNTEKWVNVDEIKSGSDFYISIPADSGVAKIEKITGTAEVEVKAVNIWFLERPGTNYQNLLLREPYSTTIPVETEFDYNISILGNLKVIKVNKDNTTIKLPGVEFKVQNKDTGKYVKKASDGTISYVDSKEEGTTFITDQNGEFTIENLIVGTYVAYETKNPNYGYAMISEGKEKEVIVDKTAELQIPNKQIYVKLSGYVWVDEIDITKQEDRDNLYDTSDSKDLLFNGITVRLKDKTTGQIVMKTVTSKLDLYTDAGNNGNGEYLFEDVLIEKLSDYYIEFEYDGLTYTNVIPHIDRNNGSKASESDRNTFNEKFNVVEGETTDTGYTRDASGNSPYKLEYDKNGNIATLSSDGDYEIVKDNNGNDIYIKQTSAGEYTITSNTNVTNYIINDHFTYGDNEIRYINLGLYKRDQPDISLKKDLYNVKVSVNGYDHVYLYDSYYTNMFEEPNSNIGVEWGYEDLRKGGAVSYTRAIYKSDYEYENAADKDKELKVSITYELEMINESSSLTSKINSIVDYYDARYTDTINIGTSVDNETGTVTGEAIEYDTTDYNANGYRKIIIKNGTTVEASNSESIYIQFELTREAVADILHDKNVGEVADELLENVAEINSYSTYYGDKIYAGIDRDSNPGNCVPGATSEYEDDTFACPALQLEVSNAREMTGTVFVDKALGDNSDGLMTGQIRQGNGQYDGGETGIAGVEVTLTENSGTGQVYTATTNERGNFLIQNYIPGNYTLTYTWGDETYTVQNYKGTVYDEARYESNQNNKYWYKEETRYTDAIDNYNTDQEAPKGSRLQIDAEMGNTTELTRTKMDSTTPTMGISVEYETAITNWNDDNTFKVSNVDFGIIERARQVLEVSKDVTGVKITLANGQVIVDAKIENGELKGTTAGVTYGHSDSTSKGFVKAEMDNELIQGATIQIEYTVTVANKSEVDYDSEEYYKYGQKIGNVITQQPTGVYDYLDGEMVLDETQDNGKWTVISSESYQSENEEPTIVESYFEEGKSTQVGEDGTETDVYTWSTSQTGYQRIFTQWATEMTEERTVRDNKLENKTILRNEDLEKEIEPGKDKPVSLYTSKVLANADEIDLNNDLEVTEIKRTQEAGRIVDVESSYLYDQGERVTVTPPTGDDQNYLPYIILGITSCIILGAGVVIIKRKAI